MAELEDQMDKDAIQVRLKLDHDSWHGVESEGVWTKLVKPLADKAIVEVDNIPFFTKSLSLRDKISVVFGDNEPMLESIVERAGHSTYRVFIQNKNIEALRMLDAVKVLGCDWEKTNFRGGELYALDIPPEVDIYEVYNILEKGQTEGSWLFEEGYVGHPLRGDPVSPLA
jgi:hypothetical protein